MPGDSRPIQFREYLPEIFRSDEVNGVSFLSRFLAQFEALFEELQAEIEGAAGATQGGIPDLFDPASTPPAEFHHLPQPAIDYLNYLASWIGLPLRQDKPVAFNRDFFRAAVGLSGTRGTLAGMDAMLRAWTRGDLFQLNPPLPLLTDLTRANHAVDTIFQLDVSAQLGFNTTLGEGPPFFFLADLTADPTVLALRQPAGLDSLQRAARRLLDLEKPAHTYYELRLRAFPMQLAPPGVTVINGRTAAQLDVTTLLWDEPLIFDSDF
jgi:phage tail-like protein